MQGSDAMAGGPFGNVDLDLRVPSGHPLRVVQRIANEVPERQPMDRLDFDLPFRRFVGPGCFELCQEPGRFPGDGRRPDIRRQMNRAPPDEPGPFLG